LAPAESIVSAFLPTACFGPRLRRTAFGLFILFLWPSDINIGMNKFDTFYESIMDDALYGQAGSKEQFDKEIEETGDVPEDAESANFDKEPIAMIESHMAKVNLNLGMAGEIAADAASPGVNKRAGELGAEIQRQLHDFMDNFGPEEDAESPMDATDNITGEINGNGRMAAEAISNIYSLVEDEGQEMLDKQAAEKLEDIKEFVSNLLRNLNNRLD